MKISRIVPIRSATIPIPADMAPFLGLRRGCQVNIVPMMPEWRSNVAKLVLSTIPYDIWPSAIRMEMTIPDIPGSQYECARVLAEHGANILLSESLSTPDSEIGVLDIVFHFPATEDFSEALSKASVIQQSISDLHIDLLRPSVVLQSQFHASAPKPLQVLSKLHQETETHGLPNYTCLLEEHLLILDKEVHESLRQSGAMTPHSFAMLLVDTEERCCTIRIEPNVQRLLRLEFDVSWLRADQPAGGVYCSILKELRDSDFNIIRSYDYILEKAGNKERSRLCFYGYLTALHKSSEWENRIKARLSDLNVKGNLNIIAEDSVSITIGLDNIPRCFFARPSMAESDLRSQQIESFLVDKGFSVLKGRFQRDVGFIRDQIVNDIKQSVCLVSLWIKDENRKLSMQDRVQYAASEWLLFEQEVARANGIRVFTLREKCVREDNVARGEDCYDFDSADDDFYAQFEFFKETFEHWLDSDEYYDSYSRAVRRSRHKLQRELIET